MKLPVVLIIILASILFFGIGCSSENSSVVYSEVGKITAISINTDKPYSESNYRPKFIMTVEFERKNGRGPSLYLRVYSDNDSYKTGQNVIFLPS